ncbi:hypothetical protein AB0J51_11940 [Micromonospora echinofusca]|uniref:hypothetical protein n=1 Tax=Micromonospora TaxID=1873 RepID=UPI0034283B9E
MVDIRWLALVAAFVAVTMLVRKRSEWANELLTAAAIATLLITVLFFIPAPPFG